MLGIVKKKCAEYIKCCIKYRNDNYSGRAHLNTENKTCLFFLKYFPEDK